MKKIIVIFLIIILGKTICFSQTILPKINQDSIVLITSNQLKYTNLIFIEHNKLLKENRLLNKQVQNYKLKLNNFEKSDSLKCTLISNYKNINEDYAQQIEQLNKSITKKNKVITGLKIGCFTVGTGLLLFLILK